jgi:hypothetical protein
MAPCPEWDGSALPGFFSLVSTTSFMSSLEGPLGPGFELPYLEKRREYFLLTSALWKSNKVAAETAMADLPIRFGVMNRVQSRNKRQTTSKIFVPISIMRSTLAQTRELCQTANSALFTG